VSSRVNTQNAKQSALLMDVTTQRVSLHEDTSLDLKQVAHTNSDHNLHRHQLMGSACETDGPHGAVKTSTNMAAGKRQTRAL